MPNHVENFLEITSSEDESITPVLEFIKGKDRLIDFDKVIPYPEKFAQLDNAAQNWEKEHPEEWKGHPVDGFNSGGYEWCIRHWGTKWNAYEISIYEQDEDYRIIIKFLTAWSPPSPVLLKLAELFPQFEFNHEYYEKGGAYCGSTWYSKGHIEKHAESEYWGFRGG